MFIDSLADVEDDFQKAKMDENLTSVWETLELNEPFPCEDMQVVQTRVEELKVCALEYDTLSMKFMLNVQKILASK